MSGTVTPHKSGTNLLYRHHGRVGTDVFSALSAMPAFHKWDGYDLIFRAVHANIKYLRDKFPEAVWKDGAEEHISALVKLEKDAHRVIQIKSGDLPAQSGSNAYQYKRLPRNQQRRALLMSWDRAAFALLMEQRTGKTKVIIDNAAYLFQKKRLHTLVIVTINGVHRNWIENEVPEDLPDWCPRECFFMRAAHTQARQKQFVATLHFKGLRIFSFNVEALSREGVARNLFEMAVGDGKKVMVAVDESSDCMMNYDSKRAKYLINSTKTVEFKRILTGTQVPEGKPDQLFAQYTFLDKNILGYDAITPFRTRYCVKADIKVGEGETRNVIVPGCKNLEELKALIDGHSYRVRRSECMDLPPKVYKRWPVEMSTEQRRIYTELKREFIVECEGRTLTAAMAMTRALRLQQIVSGWFPMDEAELVGEETWSNIRPIPGPNNRMQALQDILRTHEDKCIIWARFRPDLEAIQKLLGDRAVSYHGGIKSEQKAKNYRAFRNDKDIHYMVANQVSAGRGLTMPQATMSVYYSNTYRLVDRLQSEDRTEGDEKKRDSTLIIDIECVASTDGPIIRALRSKKDMADLINGDPKGLFIERNME